MKRILLFFALFSSVVAAAQEKTILPTDSNAVKEYFFAGLREKLKENYVNAGLNFNKVISLDPNNDAVLFELASVNYRQNKLQEAEDNLKRAIAINKSNTWYYKLLGEVYKRTNNMTALIGVFNELVRLDPENDDYYFDRANAWFLSGNTEEALKNYDIVEKKFGMSQQLTQARQRIMMEGKTAPASSEIDKIIADNPDDIKNYLYLSGVLLEKNKKQEALDLLLKAKAKAPDNFEVNLALADIYRSQKNQQLSFEALKAAFASPEMPVDRKVKIIVLSLPDFGNAATRKNMTELAKIVADNNPADAKALALYGDVLYRQGMLQDARQQYKAALKISDQLYAVWEQLMSLQIGLGDYAGAIASGDEALSVYPNQAILYFYMAFAQHRIGKNDAAITNIKFAQQLDTESPQLKAMIYGLQAEIYIDQNKAALADDAFNKAIATDPNNHMLLNNYAYYLALRNTNLAKAAALIAKAAAALPQNQSIADTYALVLFKQEKYDEAKVWIDKALQNNEAANPVYLEHLGDILFMKGAKEEAVAAWQKAKQAGNDAEKLTRKINEKKYIK